MFVLEALQKETGECRVQRSSGLRRAAVRSGWRALRMRWGGRGDRPMPLGEIATLEAAKRAPAEYGAANV